MNRRNFQKSSRLGTGDGATSFQKYNRWCDDVAGDRVVSVRQIPPNRRSVTGLVPSRKNGTMVTFESALERDLVTRLEFDYTVLRYNEQPLELVYVASTGRPALGVPDFLIEQRVGSKTQQILCDVKYRREIFERWDLLKPRLKAARAHARAQGWRYRIYTEVEIRTPYLNNAKFLLPYQRCAPNANDADTLMAMLAEVRESTPGDLICAISSDRGDQARLIPTMWKLVADRFIGCDLELPLTMTSKIWGM